MSAALNPGRDLTVADLCAVSGKSSEAVSERFWRKVEKTDGCWLWRGAVTAYGYGSLRLGGLKRGRLSLLAHRVAWVLSGRVLADGLHLLHSLGCVSTLCVRPEHLRLGTQAENNADRNAARTYFYGEENWLAKLTTEQVLEIRAQVAAGRQRRAIAEAFDISPGHVKAIANRKRWQHLPEVRR